jgi:large subunit ribosomal protein L4
MHNMSGKEVGSVDLDPEVFAAKIHEAIVHETVRWQLARRRAGTHQALTRSMMKGGKKKPWKQKGTGRARAGSGVSPLWVGGASIHGPLPRDYDFRLSKRSRRQALASVLTSKVQEEKLVILDKLQIPSGKTKDFAAVLKKIGIAEQDAIVVTAKSEDMVTRSSRNIQKVLALSVAGVNVYDLLRHKYIVSTKDGIEALQARVKGQGASEEAAA